MFRDWLWGDVGVAGWRQKCLRREDASVVGPGDTRFLRNSTRESSSTHVGAAPAKYVHMKYPRGAGVARSRARERFGDDAGALRVGGGAVHVAARMLRGVVNRLSSVK